MNDFFKKALHFVKQSKFHKMIVGLAVLVVFVTTYALILPAITLDQDRAKDEPGITVASSSEIATPSSELASSENNNIAEVEAESSNLKELEMSESSASSDSTPPADSSSKTETSQNDKIITVPTTLKQTGADYEVTVTFNADAKLPLGVELKVSEVKEDTDEYKAHVNKAKELLKTDNLSYARFFDISFIKDGKEIEPAASVEVTINPKEIIAAKDEPVKAIHFLDDGKVELLDVQTVEKHDKVTEISYDVESFSNQGIVVAATDNNVSARTADDQTSTTHRVSFVYTDSDDVEHDLSTLTVQDGKSVGVSPDNPFRAGYRFVNWQDKVTGEKITADTIVTKDMTVEAIFERITIYSVRISYYYTNHYNNKRVNIDTEIYNLEDKDLPFQIRPPASTRVTKKDDPSLEDDVVYYPNQYIIELKEGELATRDAADGNIDHVITIEVPYEPYQASYTVRYMLEKETGDGYSQIQEETGYGVIGEWITPHVLTYPYATYEKADTGNLEKESGQVYNVYYKRGDLTLSYATNSRDYIAPQTARYGVPLTVSNVRPTRQGYTFAGWYDNAELTGDQVQPGGSVKLEKNTTLYAKWTPQQVPYTVEYYKEVYDNATGTTRYVYDSSTSQRALTDSTVRAIDAAAPPTSTTIGTGYEKDIDKNTASTVIIKPDGTSVLQVYYKLTRYNLVFNLNSTVAVYNSNVTMNTGTITMNGQTYTGSNYVIRNVVLGQDISSQWPSDTSTEVYDSERRHYVYAGYYYGYIDYSVYFDYWSNGNGNNKTKRFELTEDLLAGARGNTVTYTAYWTTTETQASVEYWLQQPNGTYQRSTKYSQSFIRTGALVAKEIYGYTYRENYTPSGYQSSQLRYNPYTYRFYYDRERYNISYYYGSQLLRTRTGVLVDANINSSTYNYTPNRPSDVDSDYTWGGWYADAALTTKYEFSTMPNHNVVLYARWVAPQYTVTFDVNGGTSTKPADQTIDKYQRGIQPPDPTRENYTFTGWYLPDGTLYDWSKPVTGNVNLTARWRLNPLTYTVNYVDMETGEHLSAPKVVTSPAFEYQQTISESALAIAGYRPDNNSQSIKLDYDAKKNVITFYYTAKVPEVHYTVEYVLQSNPNIHVAASVPKMETGDIINVREKAVPVDKKLLAKQLGISEEQVDDYYALQDTIDLVLSSKTENNVITFYYVPYDMARIKVNYLDMDGNPIPGQEPQMVSRKRLETYLVDHKTIKGYAYHHSKDSKGGENVASYYINSVPDYSGFEINLYYQRELTLQARSQEKVYDAKEFEVEGIDGLRATFNDNLEEGDHVTGISFSIDGEGEGDKANVGSYGVTPSKAVITDSSGNDRTNYYKITYLPGTLTINKRPVNVAIDGQVKEKIYDGQAESITYTMRIDDESGLYKESSVKFQGEDSEKIISTKDAETYNLRLINHFVNTDENFDVTLLITDGKLTIKPRKVTLTSASAYKGFDGKPLTAETVTVSEATETEGLIFGEGFGYHFTGSQTSVGTSENIFSVEAGNLQTKLSNYEIWEEFGDLTVLPTVNLQKTSQDWTPLAGGKFKISRWSERNGTWLAVTGVDGEMEITSVKGYTIPVGLSPGRYRLEETAAPDGYIVVDKFLYFNVTTTDPVDEEDESDIVYHIEISDENGQITSSDSLKVEDGGSDYSYRLQIANEEGRSLPETGGRGNSKYLIIGLILMVMSLAVYQFKKIKRERGETTS